ncbi:polysaccharide deacetylase [Streptomyces sp. NPDC004542]|uniref:polysaccharide deacetylase family protein n=1 Tax=Streptomyces sp. NPDC004542 TaxID=3154281 RepID=UPI0033BA1009
MSESSPWKWSDETWLNHVNKIRAGRRLAPASWPGGAKVAVALSFDPDHETIPLRDGDTGVGSLARGEFGSRAGAPRILDLLERHHVPATFFMPAVSALLHPQEIKAYAAAGHEIGAHGWIHERNLLLPEAEERELAHRSMDTVERLSGQRPVGIRTPSADFSEATLSIIREVGLRYDSSLMADDWPYEILENGEPSGIVELPMEWIRDDAPYFSMDRYGSLRPYTPPRQWITILIDEFDAAYAEGGVFQLICHPHVIGHRSRMWALEELLRHINGHDGVWYATHGQVVDHVTENAVEGPLTGGSR